VPSKKQPTNIRDLRESKNLSQDKVAEAAGITYSRFVRIEEGSGKTTPEEVAQVMNALKAMESGTRKLAGRPFKDALKQAAVLAARASGGSVADAMGVVTIAPARKKAAPKSSMAAALKKPRSRKA
jgi:transcriptional regulator with XRE-family HTH domain